MNKGRNQLLEAAQSLSQQGMNIGTAGNLSLRDESGMLITPSGINYLEMTPQDLVGVSIDGQPEPNKKPSSEWRFHLEIYRRYEQAQAIIHTHSTYATALSCLQKEMPAFHYEVAFGGGKNIRCAAYATFGTEELAENIVRALKNRRACLMANHGMVCHGPDLRSALALAQKIEQLAQIYMTCLRVGNPKILDDAEMETVVEKFRNYG